MKSAGVRLEELVNPMAGKGVNEDECREAQERAMKKRLDEKAQVLAVAAAKAEERAAKMAATRAKAKHVQLRHELRIRENESRKLALKAQDEREQEVLKDIVAKR